jgi:hypothetical protein
MPRAGAAYAAQTERDAQIPGAAARRIALFEMRYLWVRARVSPARDIQC